MRERSIARGGLFAALLVGCLLFASPSLAQQAAGTTLEEANRAAERAESAAAEARALLERLRGEAPAEAALPEEAASDDDSPIAGAATAAGATAAAAVQEVTQGGTPTPETAPAEAGGVDAVEQAAQSEAIERAERAAEEATQAAREARVVANEARAALRKYEDRYARTGPYLGIHANYAIEDFETDLDVSNGRSAAIVAGYRVHRHIAVELRGEYFDEFDVTASSAANGALDSELDGFFVVASTKVYPLTGSLQPFFGVGVGGMNATLEGTDANGLDFERSESGPVFRAAAGLDFFVSENLVLNLEAAYLTGGSDLDAIDFGTVGAGVTFRF